MRKVKALIIGLTTLALAVGPALAQPAPGGGPYAPGPGMMGGGPQRPGSGPMSGPYHHHHPYYGPRQGGWHRGDRFYGPPPMVIHNYGYYNLAPPPPGYYWVRSNNQFLMIAIASGIIANILTMPMH